MTVDFAPYRLEPFRKEHEKAVVALIEACYSEYGQRIELDTLDSDLLRIEETYRAPDGFFRILIAERKVIGTVAMKGLSHDAAELKRVFLDGAFRGRGLGKKLSLWAFARAGEGNCTKVDIWSDVLYETAHHLYRGLGARDTGRRRELGGVNDVDEFCFVLDLT